MVSRSPMASSLATEKRPCYHMMGVPQLVRVAGYMKRRPPFLKQHVVPEFGPRGAHLSLSLYLIYRASLGAHCLLFPLHVVSLGHFLNSFSYHVEG